MVDLIGNTVAIIKNIIVSGVIIGVWGRGISNFVFLPPPSVSNTASKLNLVMMMMMSMMIMIMMMTIMMMMSETSMS